MPQTPLTTVVLFLDWIVHCCLHTTLVLFLDWIGLLWKSICNPVYPVGHNFYDEIPHAVERLPKLSSDARAFADSVFAELQQEELGDVVASFVRGNTDYDSEDFSNYI